MNVVIIGSGNVAWVLGKKIKKAGHSIVEVAGRNKEMVSALSALLQAQPCFQVSNVTSLADLYLLAVSDKSLHEIADELRLPAKVVVHTAAAQPLSVLQCCSEHYGVIYPLQTLHKEACHFPEIPLLIDGECEETISLLKDFCNTWSAHVSVISDDERMQLHLGAVFANNFVNHLLALTERYCAANHLDFNLLQPIIAETFSKLQDHKPSEMQTGPAIRHDTETIEKHRQLLVNNNAMLKVYELLTKSIQQLL